MKTKGSIHHTFIKKHWMKPFISLAIIFIIFFNSSSVMNTIALATTSPKAYYNRVEKANLKKHVESLTKAYSSYLSNQQKVKDQQLGRETTLQANFDSSITNGTSFEGLKSIKATMISMINGNASKTNVNLSCNDEQLTSIEAYTLNDLIYILIPDLSKAFLKLDLNDLQGDTSSISQLQNSTLNYWNDPNTVDLLSQLIVKYGNILIDNIDNVTMKENTSVTADNIKSYYTKLTVSINELDTLNISKAILDTAKDDTKLRDFCVDLGLCTKKEYKDTINDGLSEISEELKSLKDLKSNGENILSMYILVNDKGDVVGRNFKTDDGYQTMSIGYKTTRSLTKMGVEAWVNSDDLELFHANGRLTTGFKGISGDFIISYYNSDSDNSSTIYVDMNNVKYSKGDTIGRLNGDFTINSNDLEGVSFHVNFTGEPGKQDFLFDLLENDKSIANISASVKDIPFTDFSLPTSDDKIYDMNTQLNDYFKEANVKQFLNGIKEKSSLPSIDSYMDELLDDYDADKDTITDDLESFSLID